MIHPVQQDRDWGSWFSIFRVGLSAHRFSVTRTNINIFLFKILTYAHLFVSGSFNHSQRSKMKRRRILRAEPKGRSSRPLLPRPLSMYKRSRTFFAIKDSKCPVGSNWTRKEQKKKFMVCKFTVNGELLCRISTHLQYQKIDFHILLRMRDNVWRWVFVTTCNS